MPDEDLAAKLEQLLATTTTSEQRAFLDSLLSQAGAPLLSGLRESPPPTVRRRPRRVRGFRVRLDLQHAKPPVWRRLVLPGDLTLDELHDVIQAAMGWSDCHLHRFRTGESQWAPHFVTEFDIEEGDEGILEDDVRLDQLVADTGDRLWYEYDFGDGWEHVLKVEQVLPEPPEAVELLAGRRACPPEDVGGLGGYAGVAAWVESGYRDELLPEVFEHAAQAHAWLPEGWHPAEFDLELAREAVRSPFGRAAVDDEVELR